MKQQDGREIARQNELRALKSIYKFGWLRTRDIAVLVWQRQSAATKQWLGPVTLTANRSSLRMAQRTLQRLRESHLVFVHTGPDGSLLYGLSEAGARSLVAQGIPARSAKDWLRRFSIQQYHHRRIANEVAIGAVLQGYRVATEREIAMGQWLGGMAGVLGKKPDVLIRSGKSVWWVEVDRSRRNQTDAEKLLNWLDALWPPHAQPGVPASLPGGHELIQVVFIANRTFGEQLAHELRRKKWAEEQISSRILHVPLLYVTEAKFLLKASVVDRRGQTLDE